MKKNTLVEIDITDFQLSVLIGTKSHERKERQPLIFDVHIRYDAYAAMLSDQEHDVIDYWQLCKQIKKHVEQSEYFLLETLLNDLLTRIMVDERIQTCRMAIHKPLALADYGAKVSVSGSASR